METRTHITESMLMDFFNRELSDAEEREILIWREACDENRKTFDRVRQEHLRMRWGTRATLIRGDYSSIRNRIEGVQKPSTTRRTVPLWIRIASVAAVVALAVGTIMINNYFTDKASQERIARYGAPSHKAIIESLDGMHRGLDSLQMAQATQQPMPANPIPSGNKFHPSAPILESPIYNKVIIPRGSGSYHIALSDGTTVWLNSDSRIEYPIRFTTAERRVRLSGEAYFEVARDEQRPFIVETEQQQITVLGTKFNVDAYPKEPVQTTLASGSVKVAALGGEVVLVPGEQAVTEAGSQNLAVRKVSIEDVISWKEGVTSIEHLTLTEALKVVSRSYDVDFDLSNLHENNIILRGSFPNDERLNVVLSVLEKVADVKFKMDADGKIRVEN